MSKRQHRIHNCSDYNAALVNHGRIMLWFDEVLIFTNYLQDRLRG